MDYEEERASASIQEREMQIYEYKLGKKYRVWQALCQEKLGKMRSLWLGRGAA